jgi:hypothetical protein
MYKFIYIYIHLFYEFILYKYISSIVHEGYFHGHDTLPLHDKTCSAIDEQTENGPRKTPPTTHSNMRRRKRSEVKSENLNTTHAKSCLHRGMWNGQRYGRTLHMF